MKNLRKKIIVILCSIFMLFSGVFLTACDAGKYITSIEKTETVGLVDYYTIYYSDGSTYEFSVTNGANGAAGTDGKDGVDGKDGTNGKDGTDGKDGLNGTNGVDGEDGLVSIEDIYNQYVAEYGDISYAEFLEEYLNISISDNSLIINRLLQSCMKVYTEFTYTNTSTSGGSVVESKDLDIATGSAVIYKIDEDYTYILTNYHVVFDHTSNEDSVNNIGYRIFGYLYGSEGHPTFSGGYDTDGNMNTDSQYYDEKGYPIYSYGDYGIELQYVGGSIDYDVAIVKASTDELKDVNSNIKAVELAEDYYVGQEAIAIGNALDDGITVTEGIVSVDSEYISIAMDDTERTYRCMRFDTAIYGGNSGGGLFNNLGQFIGIPHVRYTAYEHINYAVPVDIVKKVVDNIFHYYDGENPCTVHKMKLGVLIEAVNSKYVYDASTGYGKIKEDIMVREITEDSIIEELQLEIDDQMLSLIINGIEYSLERIYNVGDLLLTIHEGDSLAIKYIRDSVEYTSKSYTVVESDIV